MKDKKIIFNPKYIAELVQSYSGLGELSKPTRKRPYVYFRNVYYKLCKDFCPSYGLVEIGAPLNKNHATVFFGLKTFENFKDQGFFSNYMEVYYKCKNHLNELTANNRGTVIKSIEDLEAIYKDKFLKQKKQIDRLTNSETLIKVIGLDEDNFYHFEQKTNEFLTMIGKR